MIAIPQMEPVVTDEDRLAVEAYMGRGGWLTEFVETRRFERAIADAVGARHCAVAPNGTLALFLALSACGIGRDDEVIVPDLTMAASATAVLLAGARVVFVDVEQESHCLDLDAAWRAITPRTRAVMFVSLNGRAPRGLADFVDRCRARDVRVIEDAAQALGSRADGRALGTLGDCGCFSFSSQKIVTTGQGGAVVTDDDALAAKMRLARDFGRTSGGSDHYLSVGWNFKFTDLQAVIGITQIARLEASIARKRRMFALYRDCLAGVEEVRMQPMDLESQAPWFIDVLVDDRDALAQALAASGIGSRPFYPALHTTPALNAPGSFPVAEVAARVGLWLPSSLRVSDEEIAHVCSAIRRFFRRDR